jgi:pyruvate/2-oxoglutarate dehydrogenase complex dihydrolipoamide acyltransferase (E2) component
MQLKELTIPQLNVNDTKVTIENIRFNNLDHVEVGDILYTVSTSKSIDDYAVDFAGYIVFFVKDGDEVEIGKSAGTIFVNKDEAIAKLAQLNSNPDQVFVNVSKKAIDYAKSINFDISLIKKDGIIKVQDIDDYIAKNK